MSIEFTEQYLPAQYTGRETETTESIIAFDENSAKQLFGQAREKLLNINEWHDLCGSLSPVFTITDNKAQPIGGIPIRGNYIRINIPGPGIATGRGFDWVIIEKIAHIKLDDRQEFFFMQVRPAAYPLTVEHEIAHFYKNSATSSFVIVREICQVTASVFGRNEVPNTDSQNLVDRIRNQVVGSSGAIGLSVMQWKSLVSSLLKNEKSED